MKKTLAKVALSLGVVVGAGGGLFATGIVAAPAANASPISCNLSFDSGATVQSTPPSSTCTDGQTTPPDGPGPMAITTPAAPTTTAPSDGSPATTVTSSAPAAVPTASAAPVTPVTGSLAFTGTDVAQTVLIGAVLIGGGLLTVRASRRRRVS